MQKAILRLSGLHTNENPFSDVPVGGMAVADNCVSKQPGVIESRRGFKQVTGAPANTIRGLHFSGSIVTKDTSNAMASYSLSGLSWTTGLGTHADPDTAYRMNGEESNKSLYFTSNAGIMRMASPTTTPVIAGVKKGISTYITASAAGIAVPTNAQVAYRHIWGAIDPNNIWMFGAPSARVVFSNSSGATDDVTLRIYIPTGITTANLLQLYRSQASASSSTEPSDVMQQIYEVFPTAGDITNGYVDIVDRVPDSGLGAFGYFSANQEGLAESNETPPMARDLTVFNDCMFYASTRQKWRLQVTLLGTGSPSLQLNDTITVSGVVFTAKAAEAVGSNEFQLFTAGTYSSNVENTMRSFVNVLNRTASVYSTPIYAYYDSGYQDTPGRILIEERTVNSTGSAFTVSSSRGGAFEPPLGSAQSATRDSFNNGLMYSKPGLPDAVPLDNFIKIPGDTEQVNRIMALRDTLFVFMRNSLWRINGDYETFRYSHFSDQVKLLAPWSLAKLNDNIYALTTKGLAVINENGVSFISTPIDFDLMSGLNAHMQGGASAALIQNIFACSHENENMYYVWLGTTNANPAPQYCYGYNSKTKSWTKAVKLVARDAMIIPSGISGGNDMYLLGRTLGTSVSKQRRDFSILDYADEDWLVTCSAAVTSGTTQTLTLSSVANLEVGDLLEKYPLQDSRAKVLTIVGNDVTVQATGFVGGGAGITVYKAIDFNIELLVEFGSSPAELRQFNNVTFMFRTKTFDYATSYIIGDISTDLGLGTNIDGDTFLLSSTYPTSYVGSSNSSITVPRIHARSQQLRVKLRCLEALSMLSLVGVAVGYGAESERGAR